MVPKSIDEDTKADVNSNSTKIVEAKDIGEYKCKCLNMDKAN